MNEKLISDIKRYGKTAKGKLELIKHHEGKRLNLKQAVNAHCFDCMGFYVDGKQDCNLAKCPLHPFMSYNENRIKRKIYKSENGGRFYPIIYTTIYCTWKS
ncbi:MAG: hypothetical protein ABSD50_02775 [Smithella sp.]|jgi:hypothetical protein